MQNYSWFTTILLAFAIWCAGQPSAAASKQRGYNLRGVAVDAQSKQPLVAANIYLAELSLLERSRQDGSFYFGQLPSGIYTLRVSYVGYETRELNVALRGDTTVAIALQTASLGLQDVVVAGRSAARCGSALQVDQEALAHIQPASLAEVFSLLPGGLTRDGNLSEPQQAALRQVGQDDNTSLGTSIMVDGVPMSNNGNLNRFNSDQKIQELSTVNAGIDLRMLSTDHFQRVTVERGISSARYGDLTSGAVILDPKRGVMPWEARCKADPLLKMAYVGKGIRLPVGTLHSGLEFTTATPDERIILTRYSRYSAQLTYSMAASGAPFSCDLRAAYIGTLQSSRRDEDVMLARDSYNAWFSRYQLASTLRFQPSAPWLYSATLRASADFTDDRLQRDKTISLSGAMPLPIADAEGEYEGIYLPHIYASSFTLTSRPLHIFARGDCQWLWPLWGGTQQLTLGAEVRYEKNLGAGWEYDTHTPPAPGSPSCSRPRRYDAIPPSIPLAIYLEDKMNYSGPWGEMELMAGVRMAQQLGINPEYKRLQRPAFEPRINAFYAFPAFSLQGVKVVFALRGGYGLQAKWPTLDMLEPPTSWFDFISLNYYSQQETNRWLLITTYQKQARNPDLRAAVVQKFEAGLEIRVGAARLELTLFEEIMESGFTYKSHYLPFAFNSYTVKGSVAAKPTYSDLTSKQEERLKILPIPSNGLATRKRGIEYRLLLPKWRLLETSAEISGAYFHTIYDISEPVEYLPMHTIHGGRPYPYVGIYSWNSGRCYSMVNTTARLYTHIPALRLLFSTAVQVVWRVSSQSLPTDGLPIAYIDLQGRRVPFDPELAGNADFKPLVREFNPEYFDPDTTPFEITLNLKASKEIGNHVTLSFFANRILGVMPPYRAKFNRLVRRSYAPYWGMELKLKF